MREWSFPSHSWIFGFSTSGEHSIYSFITFNQSRSASKFNLGGKISERHALQLPSKSMHILSLFYTLCKVLLTIYQSSTLNCIQGFYHFLQQQRQNLKKHIECRMASIISHKMHAYVSNMLRTLPTLMAKHMLVTNDGSLWHSMFFLNFVLVYCKKWLNPAHDIWKTQLET